MAGPAQAAALLLLASQVPLGAAQHAGLALLDEAQHLGLEALQGGRGLGKQPAHPLPLCHGCTLDEGHRASGLRDARTQLVHAVLHLAQDFGLLGLLERALLLQRHQLVAAVFLGSAGLAQAHALGAAVALQRPQVARAQALLQPAQRRHEAVPA